jgi:hypothetical protein
VDAWYDDAALAIEFDGQIKYSDPRHASSPGKVLWDEKRREDAMRALGVRFVRVVNDDLGTPWPGTAARIGNLLNAPYIGVRRFRAVRTDEPGGASDAA